LKNLFVILLLFSAATIFGQASGPIIENFGKVYPVNPDYKTQTDLHFKVVFDVSKTAASPENRNTYIETAARFLNMHAQNGVPIENLDVALIIHGSAYQDVLNDTAYAAKHQIANPNSELISALKMAGVQILLCGQSAASRKVVKADVLPEIAFSLSAMTALIQLQNQGYQLINF
jgi:intracellular sulfur oxidation DsrE/DsrF family protein